MGILSTLKVLFFVKNFFSETAKHSASETECFTECKTKGTKVEKNMTNSISYKPSLPQGQRGVKIGFYRLKGQFCRFCADFGF